MGRSFTMLAALLAGVSLAAGALTPPTTESEPAFAVRATERLVIRKGARIRGGAVAAFGTPRSTTPDAVPQLVIEGARVLGDAYGASVRLGRRTSVQRVFAGTFTAERGARYRELSALPLVLPPAPPALTASPGEEDLIVPARARVHLTGHPARVDVQAGGTLVLAGGQFQLERLTLGDRARLEVEAPSRLLVLRSFRTGARAYVGPARKRAPLNLSIVVAGADVGAGPRVLLGERAIVNAGIAVPEGRLVVGERVEAIGMLYGRDVEIGPRVSIDFPRGLLPGYDACHVPRCEIDATAGGTIKVDCSGVLTLPPGAACDDGVVCTKNDACDERAECVGYPAPPPNDPDDTLKCIRDTCDPVTGFHEPAGTPCDLYQCREQGACSANGWCVPGAPLPSGTPCDDGIPNNGTDTCHGNGFCAGTLGQFDCLANTCSPLPGGAPDLTCWLDQHPHVKNAIHWGRLDGSQIIYASWEPWRKAALQQAVADAWGWYANGMTGYAGPSIPEPPPNREPLADDQYAVTVFDEHTEAWPMFVASLGHTLAAEIGHWVPWSLCDFAPGSHELQILLASHNRYWVPPTTYPGYSLWGRTTPAHPTLTFAFMSQQGLIGATRLETIANVIGWSRRLSHFLGYFTALNAEYHWGYRGNVPVSYVLAGTILTDPQYPFFPEPKHWTGGCAGTSAFMKELLRAVNVPVAIEGVCGHATPYFISEGKYLSHGDDPYGGFREGSTTLVPPLEEFLIDQATFTAWFEGSPEAACDNVSRRPSELMVQYPPDWLVQEYCDDVAAGSDHASGDVYSHMHYHFSVAELEAAGLWDNLALRATALGYSCD